MLLVKTYRLIIVVKNGADFCYKQGEIKTAGGTMNHN